MSEKKKIEFPAGQVAEFCTNNRIRKLSLFGSSYRINLTTSNNPDQTVVISHIPKSFHAQAERAQQVPALDLMRSMMRGLPVAGYEIFKANRKEVYRDAHFSMKGNQLQPFKSFKMFKSF